MNRRSALKGTVSRTLKPRKIMGGLVAILLSLSACKFGRAAFEYNGAKVSIEDAQLGVLSTNLPVTK